MAVECGLRVSQRFLPPQVQQKAPAGYRQAKRALRHEPRVKPITQPEPQAQPATVNGKLFAAALKNAAKFTYTQMERAWHSNDLVPSRPVLHSVSVETEPGTVRLVATDTHRAYIATVECDGGETGQVTLPVETALALAKELAGQAQITFTASEDGLHLPGRSLLARDRHNRHFVNWRKSVPNRDKSTAVTLQVAELLQGVNLVNIIAKDDNGRVRFEVGAEDLTLRAESDGWSKEQGWSTSGGAAASYAVPMLSAEGEHTSVHLSASYVKQFLQTLGKRSQVTAYLQPEGTEIPVALFTAPGVEYVVMPMGAK